MICDIVGVRIVIHNDGIDVRLVFFKHMSLRPAYKAGAPDLTLFQSVQSAGLAHIKNVLAQRLNIGRQKLEALELGHFRINNINLAPVN